MDFHQLVPNTKNLKITNTMKKIIYSFLLLFLSTLSYSQTYPRGILEGIDEGYKQIPQKAPLTRNWYVGTPSYFSLKKYAPTPGNQGKYGTCTGWAVAYAARTIIEAKKQGWTSKDIITQNAFSPTYQYRQASKKISCNGTYTSQVVQSLKTKGSVPKKEFYVPNGIALCPPTPLHPSNHDKAKHYKIEEYTSLWSSQHGNNYSKVSKVKASVSEGNPVVISMICPKSFNRVGSSGLWQPTENPNGDTDNKQHSRHALCVVGYDDSKFGGAFEVRNSWGTGWGNNGYGWIKYKDFANFVYQAYEIIDFPQPKSEEPYLSGSLRLYNLDKQENLEVTLAGKTRNWNVVGPKKGGKHTYKVVPNLPSGSEMRMYLKSEQPAYVYLLGTGTVDKTVLTLFPVDGISPAMNYNNYEVALPSEDHYFKMDNTVGKNYIIVIYSKEKLDIENIRGKVTANGYGSVSQKVYNALSDLIIDSKYINFNDNEIKFEVAQNPSNKKAFAMIIEFNQVN